MSLRFPNVFANRPTDDFCFATLRSSSPLDRRWLRESQLANDFRMLQRVEITGRYSVHSFFEHRTHYSFGIGELRVRRYRAGLLVTGLVGFFIPYSYLRTTIEGEGKKVYQFRFFFPCAFLPAFLPAFLRAFLRASTNIQFSTSTIDSCWSAIRQDYAIIERTKGRIIWRRFEQTLVPCTVLYISFLSVAT